MALLVMLLDILANALTKKRLIAEPGRINHGLSSIRRLGHPARRVYCRWS